MKSKIHTLTCSSLMCTAACLLPLSGNAANVWINEIHYDNIGTDVNEGVELLGTAGNTLEGWSLLFYNGGNGTVYRTVELEGSFSDTQNGFGSLFFATSGIQNGAPDGIALVNGDNTVLEFLSYEGSLVATDGAANGLISVDIGVSETTSAPLGTSLQLIGIGSTSSDFTWTSQTQSFGDINAGQTLVPSTAVPLPAAFPLYTLSLLGLWRYRTYSSATRTAKASI